MAAPIVARPRESQCPTGRCRFSNTSSTLIVTSLVLQTGSPLFCVHLFENVNLHRLVGYQALEPPVLFFECSQPLGLADFHPSELSLPRMVGRHTDIVRRTDRLYWAPGLCFAQYPDNLFLAESLFFISCSFLSRTPAMSRPPFWDQAKCPAHPWCRLRRCLGLGTLLYS